jgi:hypothetical protein
VELRQKSETLNGVWLALILSFVLERPVSAASISALPPEPKRKADKNMWLPRELRTTATCGGYMTKAANMPATIVELLHANLAYNNEEARTA